MKNGKIKTNVKKCYKKCYKKLLIDCINGFSHFSKVFSYHNALNLVPPSHTNTIIIT